MKDEKPDEKWDRVQKQVQEGILNGYPNRERSGCLSGEALLSVAERCAKFDETVEDDPRWQHVSHCSPCYSHYLEEFRKVRLRSHAVAATE